MIRNVVILFIVISATGFAYLSSSRFFLSESIVADGYEAFGSLIALAAKKSESPKRVVVRRDLMSSASMKAILAEYSSCETEVQVEPSLPRADEVYLYGSAVSISLRLKIRPWIMIYSGKPLDFGAALNDPDLKEQVMSLLPSERRSRPNATRFFDRIFMQRSFSIVSGECKDFSYTVFWEN